MKNYNHNENKNEDEINIPPVGLLNFSRIGLKINKNKYFKDLIIYNSCYINASIQCLFRLDEFVRQILKLDNGDLTLATKNLINNMKNFKNKKSYCSVVEIKQIMGEKNEKYKYNEQRDANEFIMNYLNYLIEETKDSGKIKWRCMDSDKTDFEKFYSKFIKRRGSSLFLDIFYGLLRTEKICETCPHIFPIKFNVFNILEMPLNKKKVNNKPLIINNLLKEFFSERINPNEICPLCKGPIIYKTSINSLPKCLMIYLNRDYTNNIRNNIDIPSSLEINLDKYLYDKSLNDYNDYCYKLKGILFYEFSKINISLYKASCLVNNEQWYYFDDHHLETDKESIIDKNENPILLFYERINI